MKDKQIKLTEEQRNKLLEDLDKLQEDIPAVDYNSLSPEEKAEIDSWWEY